jgi:hypothetical protein
MTNLVPVFACNVVKESTARQQLLLCELQYIGFIYLKLVRSFNMYMYLRQVRKNQGSVTPNGIRQLGDTFLF